MKKSIIHITFKDNVKVTIYSKDIYGIISTLKEILMQEFHIKVRSMSYLNDTMEIKIGKDDNFDCEFEFLYEGKQITEDDYTDMFTSYYIKRLDERIKKVYIKTISE
jgi:hypothetical protein